MFLLNFWWIDTGMSISWWKISTWILNRVIVSLTKLDSSAQYKIIKDRAEIHYNERWISFKPLYWIKQVRFFPPDPGCEMLLSPTSPKSRRIGHLLILLCFYFNRTCSKKFLTEFISIYNAYREKDSKSNLVQI